MQAEPFSGVAVPLEVEAVAADPVEAGEGGVELFAEILREAGAVALNEAILGAVPLSQDIDGIVELRRPDSGQEAGLQEVVDQLLAGGGHRRFFAAERPVDLMCPLGSRRFGTARHGLSPIPGQKLGQTRWVFRHSRRPLLQICGERRLISVGDRRREHGRSVPEFVSWQIRRSKALSD